MHSPVLIPLCRLDARLLLEAFPTHRTANHGGGGAPLRGIRPPPILVVDCRLEYLKRPLEGVRSPVEVNIPAFSAVARLDVFRAAATFHARTMTVTVVARAPTAVARAVSKLRRSEMLSDRPQS